MAGPRFQTPITPNLMQRSIQQLAEQEMDRLNKGGWANTGLNWRWDTGPINPKADQPAVDRDAYFPPPRHQPKKPQSNWRLMNRLKHRRGVSKPGLKPPVYWRPTNDPKSA